MTIVKHRHLPIALALSIALICHTPIDAKPANTQKTSLAWVLKQHLRAVSAGVPAKIGNTEHSIYTLSAGGLVGSLEEYTSPPRFRVEMTLGPLHITRADDGVQGWEQDSTGNVRLVRGPELTEQRAETDFSLETYDPLQSKAKVVLHPQRDPSTHDYIVDATPPGGSLQTVYINPTTFLYDKIIMHEAGITGTIAISGYRAVDGVKTPSHLEIGYAGLPVVVTADLKTADYGKPFDKSLFRTPASARDYEFLTSTKESSTAADVDQLPQPAATNNPPPVSGGPGPQGITPVRGGPSPSEPGWVSVPFTTEDAEIILPVSIDGHRFKFLLDSGAGSSFITGEAAKLAGLKSEGSMAAVGYGGTTQTGLATHTTVDVGDALRLKGQLLYVIQDPRLTKSLHDRVSIDGALGYDVFARMVVRIDYPNRTITFSAPGSNLPSSERGTSESGTGAGGEVQVKPLVVPIRLENHTPTIIAAVDGRKPASFLVDTGDNGDIHLYNRYAIASKLMNKSTSPDAVTRTGFGVGGMVQEIITPGHRLDIAGLDVKGVTLATMNAGGIGDISDYAGGIGNGILSRYAVTFDYPDDTLTFEKSTSVTAVSSVSPLPSEERASPGEGAGVRADTVTPPPPPVTHAPEAPRPAPQPVDITLDDLMAKHLAALGGVDALDRIQDTRITAKLTTGGITGDVVTDFQTPDKEYEEDILGPMEVKQGYNGKDGWRADGNGNQRPLSADEMRDMRNQIYFDTNSYVLPGRMPGTKKLRPTRDAATGDYMVDIDPEGGKPATLYFNPKTFLIDKEEHTDDDVLTVTTFEGYKRFDDVMFPTEQHISNGEARYDMDLRVVTLQNNVQIASNVFDPPARDKDYAFLKPGETSASVPFELDGGEVGFVALINGHRERLLFDSGASSIAISQHTANALHLKQTGILEARGYGGSTDLHPIAINTFEIPGAIRMKDVTGVSVSMAPAIEHFLNESVAGFAGYDLLSRFVIRLDYAHKTLTFTDPAAFHPTSDDGVALDVQLDNDIPSITATVDALPAAQYLIDTGDFSTLRMYEPYITTSKLKEKYKNGIKTAGGGIAGLSESLDTHVDRFTLAGVTFHNIPTEFSLDPKGGISDIHAGSIGAGVLSRFVVTFDFPHGKVYFAPTKNAARPFEEAEIDDSSPKRK